MAFKRRRNISILPKTDKEFLDIKDVPKPTPVGTVVIPEKRVKEIVEEQHNYKTRKTKKDETKATKKEQQQYWNKKRKERQKYCGAWIDNKDYDFLKEYGAMMGITMANVVREMIKDLNNNFGHKVKIWKRQKSQSK